MCDRKRKDKEEIIKSETGKRKKKENGKVKTEWEAEVYPAVEQRSRNGVHV